MRKPKKPHWYQFKYEDRATGMQHVKYVRYVKYPTRTNEYRHMLELLDSGKASKIITEPINILNHD